MTALVKFEREQLLTVFFVIALSLSAFKSSCEQSTLRPAMGPVPSVDDETTDCFLDDRCTLLAFKNGLASRGEPCLVSWNEPDVRSWRGVTWATESNGIMVVERLKVPDCGLTGKTLYPLLESGLRKLRVLDISGNNFTGTVLPETLQICESLVVLDLSNSSLVGRLPLSLNCENAESRHGNLSPSPATGLSIPSSCMYPDLQIFNLSSNGFTGSLLPSLLQSISSVQHLDVSHNRLTGALPFQVRHLYNLKSLVLDGNDFNGSVPEFSQNCTRLAELRISNNSFTGFLPFRALEILPGLEELDVSGNNLTGILDVGRGGFKSLQMLNVGSNSFNGTVPPQICNISTLKVLNLSNNNFGGSIPPQVGDISTLQILDLANNSFSGYVPSQIGNVSTLQVLSLKYNKFTGGIPASLSGCSQLRRLRLQYNGLTGVIPSELSKLAELSILSLHHNKLRGSIPASLSNCSGLRSLWLSDNYLEGSIPPQLGNLTDLLILSISGNYYQSIIPPELGSLRNLVVLDLSYSQLIGTIPHTLCNLLHMQVFLIDYNALRGELPDCLFNYSFMRLLDASYNNISGSLPTAVANRISERSESIPRELSYTTYFEELVFQPKGIVYGYSHAPCVVNLESNSLTGEIPGSLRHWKTLWQLTLANNSLSGHIPPSLGDMSSLYILDISKNFLSGTIPSELTNLNFLALFNLSFNQLKGKVPEGGQFSTFDSSSFLGNPELCGLIVQRNCGGTDTSANQSAVYGVSVDDTILSIPDVAFMFCCGFLLGFWAVVLTLIFVDAPRHYLCRTVSKFCPRHRVRHVRQPYGFFTDAR